MHDAKLKSSKLRCSQIFVKLGAIAVALGLFHVAGQDPDSRRGGRGDMNMREFLGLNAAPDAEAAKKGAPVFAANCAGCHGVAARGAQGPDLVRSVVVLHDEKDEEIGSLLKTGRPQNGMPPFPQLSADDIHSLSQFLKLQVELAANRGTYGKTYKGLRAQPTGDVQAGSAFFQTNCAGCHSATGDLAKIGGKFQEAATMQARFIWPVHPGPVHGSVTTKDGQVIEGTVLKINDFDVALTDSDGDYHYWPRDRVEIKISDKLAGHRALLPKYTDAELHDVTAYLMTLK